MRIVNVNQASSLHSPNVDPQSVFQSRGGVFPGRHDPGVLTSIVLALATTSVISPMEPSLRVEDDVSDAIEAASRCASTTVSSHLGVPHETADAAQRRARCDVVRRRAAALVRLSAHLAAVTRVAAVSLETARVSARSSPIDFALMLGDLGCISGRPRASLRRTTTPRQRARCLPSPRARARPVRCFSRRTSPSQKRSCRAHAALARPARGAVLELDHAAFSLRARASARPSRSTTRWDRQVPGGAGVVTCARCALSSCPSAGLPSRCPRSRRTIARTLARSGTAGLARA